MLIVHIYVVPFKAHMLQIHTAHLMFFSLYISLLLTFVHLVQTFDFHHPIMKPHNPPTHTYVVVPVMKLAHPFLKPSLSCNLSFYFPTGTI